MDLDVEIFVLKTRIDALKQRVIDQHEFIERCQQRQRSRDWKTQGLVPARTYDSLAVQRSGGRYKRKPARRKKADVWRNFFTWNQFNVSPHQVIKHAEERIARLKIKLQKLEKEQANE